MPHSNQPRYFDTLHYSQVPYLRCLLILAEGIFRVSRCDATRTCNNFVAPGTEWMEVVEFCRNDLLRPSNIYFLKIRFFKSLFRYFLRLPPGLDQIFFKNYFYSYLYAMQLQIYTSSHQNKEIRKIPLVPPFVFSAREKYKTRNLIPRNLNSSCSFSSSSSSECTWPYLYAMQFPIYTSCHQNKEI